MHDQRRRKIYWFAIKSRLCILIVQFIFNIICPDHDADAFRTPSDPKETSSKGDDLIHIIFNGVTRWDGQYYIHVSKYGYTYDNTIAFYPLFPFLTHVLSTLINKICFKLNTDSSIIIAGVLVNFICFVKSALIFYDLSEEMFSNAYIAHKATILYCINPASIFFSAIYSESLFAYLTFYSMLEYLKNETLFIYLPIALSTLVRSNGVVNLGFPIYMGIKNIISISSIKNRINLFNVVKILFSTLNITFLSSVPLILLQIYNYVTFCIPKTNYESTLPPHVIKYALQNDLILQGCGNSIWCNQNIPLAYSYIQKKYWNVGFMNYYQFKQIPNFILAFPVLFISIQSVKEYFYEYRKSLLTFEFFHCRHSNYVQTKKYPKEMFVFIVHGAFLTIFCILFVHIQVSTRLLCSASPLIYWYCTLSMSNNRSYDADANDNNTLSEWHMLFPSGKKKKFTDKIILTWFLGYFFVGCFMFSNYLPWT